MYWRSDIVAVSEEDTLPNRLVSASGQRSTANDRSVPRGHWGLPRCSACEYIHEKDVERITTSRSSWEVTRGVLAYGLCHTLLLSLQDLLIFWSPGIGQCSTIHTITVSALEQTIEADLTKSHTSALHSKNDGKITVGVPALGLPLLREGHLGQRGKE